MPKFVAFLRAINVGGHVVRMEQLRAAFEALGLTGVSTFIASGNVIFETRRRAGGALEGRVEKHLANALGYDVATFIRSLDEVAAVAAHQPFAHSSQGGTLYVGFLKAAPAPALQRKVAACSTAADELHVHGRELYWLRHTRFSESTLTGATLEKLIGAPMTLRNVSTVQRLAAKYRE